MVRRVSTRQVHWRTPTVIVTAFCSGLAFAIGHHAFYQSLDGEPVDERLWDQQTNRAIGNAFAFLFRAAMGIALGAAYWQIFWVTVLRKTLALSQLDALVGLLGSVIDFMDYRALSISPLLAVMALVSWLLPLASLLPPATLSVISMESSKNVPSYTMIPAFNSSQMVYNGQTFKAPGINADTGELVGESSVIELYESPSRRLIRLATQTASQGAVPEFQASHLNSSAVVDFASPAVQCQPVTPQILRRFDYAMNCSFVVTNQTASYDERCNKTVVFLSWTPEHGSLVPFDEYSANRGFLPLESNLEATNDADYAAYRGRYLGAAESGGPATLFVARREMAELGAPESWNVLNCSLYNASYTVNLTSNGSQRGTVSLLETSSLNSVQHTTESSHHTASKSMTELESISLSYMAMMETLGMLLVGTVTTTWAEGWTRMNKPKIGYYVEKGVISQSPELMRTLLPFTTELLPLLGRVDLLVDNPDTGEPPTRPDESVWKIITTIDGNRTHALPREAFTSPTFNQSLGSTIEGLFHNITLSLFNDPFFLRRSQSETLIVLSRTRNTYAYSYLNLLLSYGLALGFVLCASLAGCAYIWLSGRSYSNRFSTVYRTTRKAGEDHTVAVEDRNGADPLPKYLVETRLALGHRDAMDEVPLQQESDSVEMRHQLLEVNMQAAYDQRENGLHRVERQGDLRNHEQLQVEPLGAERKEQEQRKTNGGKTVHLGDSPRGDSPATRSPTFKAMSGRQTCGMATDDGLSQAS